MGKELDLETETWPHIKDTVSVEKIMYSVIIALLPASAVGVYIFGYYVLAIIAASISSAVVTEYIALRLMGKEFKMDGSAIITGLLLALIIPPGVPLWIPIIGSAVGIAVGKCAFGGLGHNVFNPAIVGRLFLVGSWPNIMTTWETPFTATSTATPLASSGETAISGLFYGDIAGCIGETSALALLAGGVFLILMRYIDWRVPLAYIGTVGILMWILGKNPLFQILAGGLFLGAFFMATDYATSPATKKGRIIFAIGAGILVVVIRTIGGYPEGVAFSILIMNGFVPLIDRMTKTRTYGTEGGFLKQVERD